MPVVRLEAVTGVPLFQVAVVGSAQTGFTITAFWAKVNAVPNPGPPPAVARVEAQTVTLSPAAVELQQATLGAKIASGFLALIGRTSRIHSLKRVEKRAADARSRYQNLQNNWSSYTSDKDFQDLVSYLQNLRTQYNELSQKLLERSHALEVNRYRLQLQAHLDRPDFARAHQGVGDAKKVTLQSYGIETAADIGPTCIGRPGVRAGTPRQSQAMANRAGKAVRIEPNKGVDPAAKNAVERQIVTEKIDLERKLNEGLSKLTISSHHILTRRHMLLAQAEQAAPISLKPRPISRVINNLAHRAGETCHLSCWRVSIGGLIIALQEGKEPLPVPP